VALPKRKRISLNAYMNTNYLDQVRNLSTTCKYTTWYCDIISNASQREIIADVYYEKHHILPKCFKLGGESDIANLVPLLPREHFLCHWMLSKMFSDKRRSAQMKKALTQFLQCNKHQHRVLNSHRYEAIRRVWNVASSQITKYAHSRETLEKMRKPRSEHTRQMMRKPKSIEHRLNISKAKNGKFSDSAACVHCGKVMDRGNLSRYHNDKCKLKPV